MNLQTIVTVTLLLIGTLFVFYSITVVHTLLAKLQESKHLKSWQTLVVLMSALFLGYLVALTLMLLNVAGFWLILAGMAFLFAAFIVFRVVYISSQTIGDWQETMLPRTQLEEEVAARTAELTTSNEELRQINTELAYARDHALKASHAKSVFLANMSHELRTPLNAILGYSEMLQEDAEDLGEQRMVNDLGRINNSGKHLLSIINDILDISKIEAGRMTMYLDEFDVGLLLEDVLNAIQPLIYQNENEVHTTIAGNLGLMYADQTKVRQIMFNLLSNASKFARGGILTLNAKRVMTDGLEHCLFEVRDNGIGMTPEQMRHLFQPFMQANSATTRQYGGTGLGLAITWRFCEMMGGTIEAKSMLGVGTVFTVLLPVRVPQRQAETFSTGRLRALGKQQALIIDDDLSVRDLMQRVFEEQGYHVELASGGQEGIEIAKRLHPDLITLDVTMPDMDGWSVLAYLKADEATASIPVIMLTMLDDKERGFTLGATDFIVKPIDREQLLHVLKRYKPNQSQAPVLIVEDDESTRRMVQKMLEKEGWMVETAVNGRAALQYTQQQMPVLILLDLMMPEMDGFQFAFEFRKQPIASQTPIIVMTSKDLTKEEQAQLSGYVESIVQKEDCSQDTLLNEIQSLISQIRNKPLL